jgi:hypothetical protein
MSELISVVFLIIHELIVDFIKKLGDDSILQYDMDRYTFFAPTDAAMDFLIRRRDTGFFSDVDNILSFIK